MGAFATSRYPVVKEEMLNEYEENTTDYTALGDKDEADRRRRLASRQSSILREAMMRPSAFKNADLLSSRNRTSSL